MRTGMGVGVGFGGKAAAWTPAAISSLGYWFTAGPTWCFTDAGATTPCGDGDAVYTWVNRTGATNFVQGTAANRPVLRTASGKWYVDFDGSNDRMTISGGTFLRSAHTVLYAANHDAAQGVVVACDSGDGDPAYGGVSSGHLAMFRDGLNNTASNLSIVNGTAFVATFRSAGVSGGNIVSSVWKNGTAASGTLTRVASDNRTGIRIGIGGSAGDPFNGRLHELILCVAAITDADRAAAESHLSRWV